MSGVDNSVSQSPNGKFLTFCNETFNSVLITVVVAMVNPVVAVATAPTILLWPSLSKSMQGIQDAITNTALWDQVG